MSSPPRLRPFLYSPDVEKPEADEQETFQGLVETMRHVSEITYKDTGHAVRSVHAKSHGALRGELQVLDDLPAELRQGLFAQIKSCPVLIRLSTVPGDILDDIVSTPRGLALKVLGVRGTRLSGSEGATTQDFVLVNGPTFQVSTAKRFLAMLKPLAATTDKGPELKKVLSAVARGTEKALEAMGGESATVLTMDGHPETHVLGDRYFSQVPLRYGKYIAKISVVPASARLASLTNAPLNLNGKPTGLRDAVVDYFSKYEGVCNADKFGFSAGISADLTSACQETPPFLLAI